MLQKASAKITAPLLIPLLILRFDDLQKLNIFRDRVTAKRWIEAGRFPAPIRLGPNSIGWRASDVQEWLNRRAAVMEPAREAE